MKAPSLFSLSLLPLLFAQGCLPHPPRPLPPLSSGEDDEAPLPEISWVPGEELLLVNSRFLFDPKDERFSPVSFPTKEGEISFSASGQKVLVQQGSFLYAGTLTSLPKEPLVLPDWLKVEDPDHLAFWLSDELIYVAQQAVVYDPLMGEANFLETCRLLEVATGTFREPKGGCIRGDFLQIYQITPGPRSRVAVYSTGEGHPGVNIAFYDPERGQREIGAPSLRLYPYGPVLVHFTSNPDRLEFTTPCILEREEPPPCEVDEEKDPWRWYSWSLTQKRLVLLQKDLLYGVIPHPDGSRIAWPAPGKICVGDTVSRENTVCYPLPEREKREEE